MAVQVPGLAQGPDQVLAHALAAEDETTSSKALPRYTDMCVCVCVFLQSSLLTILNGKDKSSVSGRFLTRT